MDDVVLEHNYFENTETRYGVRFKANTRYSSFRANKFENSLDDISFDFRNGSDGSSSQSGGYSEFVWNKVENNGGAAIRTNWGGGGGGPSFIMRNSMTGSLGTLDTGHTTFFEYNVHTGGLPSSWTPF